MAVGPESPYSGGVRTSPAAAEAVRQWDHSVGPPACQIGKSAAFSIGQRHLLTLEEVTTSIMAATLANPGT